MTVIVSSMGLFMMSWVLLCLGTGSEGSAHGDVDGRRSLLHVAKRAAAHTGYACENNQIVLECAASSVIKVRSANYGRTSGFICDPRLLGINNNVNSCTSNAQPKVATQCYGQRRCQFQASNNRFGDPCRGIYKFLEAHYTCEARAPTAVQTAYACEGNDLVLECPVGQTLDIRTANYGRTSRTKCNPQVLGINNNLSMCTLNVVGQIFTQCDQQRRCHTQASNGRFGDPCVGIYKFLEVNFRCV